MRIVIVLALAAAQIAALQAELRYRRGPYASLHTAQQRAVDDASTLRAWQCDRRAGKTTAAMVEFAIDGALHPGSEYAYVALTRTSAERIVWRILRETDRDFRLRWTMGLQKLRIVQPNESALTLYGADNPGWLDKLYGQHFRRVWIDEAAFYRIDHRQVKEGATHSGMRYLVYDVLEPTVADERGSITLMSRPGNVHRGLFYDICHDREPGWSLHRWSWRDNPAIRDQVQELIARKIASAPDIEQDASFRRNWCNEWVSQSGDRVYHAWDSDRNSIDAHEVARTDDVVLGVDLGWNDATAFSLISWSRTDPVLYEIESYREREMILDAVASRCRMYMDHYPQVRIVVDPSRRQVCEELRIRYGLPIIYAEKISKADWIGIINGDLAESRIKIVGAEQSPHADEMGDLVWDRGPTGRQMERHGQANDTCDAFLYAYRYAYHYRHEPEPEPRRAHGSRAYYDQIERELEDASDRALEAESGWS